VAPSNLGIPRAKSRGGSNRRHRAQRERERRSIRTSAGTSVSGDVERTCHEGTIAEETGVSIADQLSDRNQSAVAADQRRENVN
jgi:hypothetical protein